jgi:hypothetical protein
MENQAVDPAKAQQDAQVSCHIVLKGMKVE